MAKQGSILVPKASLPPGTLIQGSRETMERDLFWVEHELAKQKNLMNALNFSFAYVPHDESTFAEFARASRLVMQFSEAKKVIEGKLAGR
jgi:hypothetical protein